MPLLRLGRVPDARLWSGIPSITGAFVSKTSHRRGMDWGRRSSGRGHIGRWHPQHLSSPPAGLHRVSLRGSGSSQLCWLLFLMGSLPEPLVPWLYLPSEFEMWIKQSWQGNYSSLSNIALGLLSADSWRVMNPFVFAAALDSLQEKVQTGREVLH